MNDLFFDRIEEKKTILNNRTERKDNLNENLFEMFDDLLQINKELIRRNRQRKKKEKFENETKEEEEEEEEEEKVD